MTSTGVSHIIAVRGEYSAKRKGKLKGKKKKSKPEVNSN